MGADRRTIARSAEVSVTVPAPVGAVWQVISDVTRTGEWSHECHEVRWLSGQTPMQPGARFRGRNRSGWLRWSRICEVVRVSAPHEFVWRTVVTPTMRDSSEWWIRLEPDGAGTRIVEGFRLTRLPWWLERVLVVINPTHVDRTQALAGDLTRLGEVAERTPAVR